MNYKKLYEKVLIAAKLEERRFFNYFDETVRELEATYGKFLYIAGEEYKAPDDLNDKCVVRSLYHNGIVDNILFLAGAGDTYKSEFLRKSQNAYNKYWHDDAKGRRIRRARW